VSQVTLARNRSLGRLPCCGLAGVARRCGHYRGCGVTTNGRVEVSSPMSALRGEAGMPRPPAPYQSDATDPHRS
jgi:hypothetical protein